MSQPTFPTQPSPTPEGIGVPPSAPAPDAPPADPAGPIPTPPTGPFAMPPVDPVQPFATLPVQSSSQPGNPPQTPSPSTDFPPAFTPGQAPTPGTDQSYAAGQPYAPDQSYAAGQPYVPGQPYTPGQPYAPQPYATQPYGVGGQPPMTPPKKKKTWLIVLIIVLAVLLVGGGGAFAYWYYAIRDDGIRGGRADDEAVTAGQAKTAQAAVRGYLQALAAGNSSDALSFSSTAPLDSTFLTDTVLAASLAINPITFQQAVRPDLTTATDDIAVTADYQIGSQSVSTTYLTTLQDGYYFIEQVSAPVSLTGTYVPDIGMKLNGVSLGTGAVVPYVELFPGSYQLTIDNSMLTLTGGQFVVAYPMDSPSLADTTVGLAADTPGQLASAATSTLDGCMAEKSLTSSCGIGLPLIYSDGKIRDVDENSTQWAYITGSSDFSAAAFAYDPQDEPAEATAPIDLKLRRTVAGAGDDERYYFYICYDVTSMSVNFSDPSNLNVSFYSTTTDVGCPDPQLTR